MVTLQHQWGNGLAVQERPRLGVLWSANVTKFVLRHCHRRRDAYGLHAVRFNMKRFKGADGYLTITSARTFVSAVDSKDKKEYYACRREMKALFCRDFRKGQRIYYQKVIP